MSLETTTTKQEKPLFEKSDVDKLTENLNKYVIKPLNVFGISGFIFDVEGETRMNLESDITDNFVEDNSAIQDHIATKPLRITLTRYVGEKVYEGSETDIRKDIASVVSKLTTVVAALPALASSANAIFDRGSDLGAANVGDVQKVDDLYGLFQNLNPSASKQQKAYLYFKALQEQKILLSVQTPFEYLTNMAIESIVATQGESSKDISNFSITLKKIRTASISLTKFDKDDFQGRAKNQKSPQVDNGKAKGNEVEPSVLIELSGG